METKEIAEKINEADGEAYTVLWRVTQKINLSRLPLDLAIERTDFDIFSRIRSSVNINMSSKIIGQ